MNMIYKIIWFSRTLIEISSCYSKQHGHGLILVLWFVHVGLFLFIYLFYISYICAWASIVFQQGVWALLLSPHLFAASIPLDCREEQGGLSRCPTISQEKLLDRVIHHAELIYRVSEESCSLFVSNTAHYPNMDLCTLKTEQFDCSADSLYLDAGDLIVCV